MRELLEVIEKRGRRDLKEASESLSKQEVRYLVDTYYMMQEDRIRAAAQIRAMSETGEPHSVLEWLLEQSQILEDQIKLALDVYTMFDPVGKWSRSIKGIGPVISAGLLAHIDITRAPTVGHIWRYAGLDPTVKWGKGQKRPWNARLKVLCYKIGESFVKVKNRGSFYGEVYAERKALEQQRNEALEFKDQAEQALQEKNYGKDTDAYKWYKKGMLPPARIHARARRYAVKLFLSHWHHIAYLNHYGEEPPLPYPIAIQGHAHYISPEEAK